MGRNPTTLGRVVWLAAGAAVLARFPGLLWPLRPDEAGFLLVARSWQPEPDSVYGHYWVDRPPFIIWLMRATDALVGPYAHRAVGALASALLVLAAGAAAREMAWRAGIVDPVAVRRLAGWVAVAAAALVSHAAIEPVAAKGELFGIPLALASCWLALRSVRRVSAGDAFAAGLLAMSAVGFKQSIVGGVVFGVVLLAGSLVSRQLTRAAALRCGAAAAAGAAVPVLVVVGWAAGTGVGLKALWYASVGFRSDASRVIAELDDQGAPKRVLLLVLVFVGAGMLLVLLLFLARVRSLLRQDAVPVVAILAMLTVDLVGVAVSGSYWRPYLLVLIPGLVLALAALGAHDQLRLSRRRSASVAVAFVVASSVLSMVAWTWVWAAGRVPVGVRTGQAIAEAARPGDRVLVYGGRAEVQWASGARSPYPYLWSLPMRTLDPDLEDLRSVLTGNDPPTWFVQSIHVSSWMELGPVESSLIRKYQFVRTACDRYRIYHLNTVEPVDVDVDCSSPWRTIWGR